MQTITAEARYGQTGQFIARITGRDKRFNFYPFCGADLDGVREDTSSRMAVSFRLLKI